MGRRKTVPGTPALLMTTRSTSTLSYSSQLKPSIGGTGVPRYGYSRFRQGRARAWNNRSANSPGCGPWLGRGLFLENAEEMIQAGTQTQGDGELPASGNFSNTLQRRLRAASSH